MSQLERRYQAARLLNPALPHLADLLKQAAAPTGQLTDESKKYLAEFAGLLQRITGEQYPGLGRLETVLRSDPTFEPPPPRWARVQPKGDALNDVVRGFHAAPHHLIGLELYRAPSSTAPEPGLHRVNVSGYEVTPTGYRLHLSDVNVNPDDPHVKSTVLEFDTKTDQFIVRNPKGPVLSARTGQPRTYANVRVVQDPPRDPKMWRALEMIRRHLPIDQIREELGYPTQRTTREKFDRALANGNTKLHNHLDYAKEKLGKWLTVTVDKVNGVSLYYNPDLFEGLISEQEVNELLRDIKRFAKDNEEGAYQVSLLDRREELHLVALDRLLETKAGTLGKLTRVRGYLRDETGRLFLVGDIEKNRAPIPLDLFIASLRSVWKEGMFPFISIDPDPRMIHSPHLVRIGGIPNELRESEFVRILVEADYLMKRLSVGRTDSLVKGFQSLPDLVRNNPDAPREFRFREWLTPRAIPVAGILETRRGKASAVLFESEVDVLSENQRQIGMFLVGTDDANPLATEMACMFTRYFPEMEDVHLPFRKLHTVFDLTRLCAIWRQRGVTTPALEQLARRPVAKVDIPKTFEAIIVPEGDVVIFGGAMTRQPPTRAVVETDRLLPLLEAAGKATLEPEIAAGEINLPRTLELKGPASVPANAEMQLYVVKKQLAQGAYREALELLNYILVQSASDPPPEAQAYRASLLIFLRRYEEALVDIERALPAFPQLVALRGTARACLGDPRGAARDADASAGKFPDDAAVAACNFATHMELLDLDRAEADLRRLELLFPGHTLLFGSRVQVETYRRLGILKARERQRQLRSLPPEIVAHVMRGVAQMSKPAEAMLSLEYALALCQQSSAPAVKELAVAHRCRFGLIWANAETGSPAGLAYASQMIAEHPDWPSGYLGKALAQAFVDEPKAADTSKQIAAVLASFDQAAQRADARDPLFADLAEDIGSPRVLAWHAGVIWLALLSEEKDAGPMLDRMIQQLGDSRDTAFIKAIRQQKELNLGKAMHVLKGRPGANAAREQVNALRLAAVQMPDHAASDPAVLRVLVVFYRTYFLLRFDATDEEPPSPDEYFKFLRQTKTAAAPEPLRSELIELRSKVVGWIETASHANVTKKFNKDGAMEAAFNARGDAIDKALKARDVQAVKQNLRAAVPEFRRLLDSARAAAAEEMAQLRKDADPLTAGLFELSLAIQQKMLREGTPPFEEVIKELPELKTTAEWQEFQAIASESPGRLWIQRDAGLVWKDVLAKSNNRIDAEVVLKVLKAWEDREAFQGRKQQDSDFETMRKELEQRIIERPSSSVEPPAPTDPDLPQGTENASGNSQNQQSPRRFSAAALIGVTAAVGVMFLFILRNRRAPLTP